MRTEQHETSLATAGNEADQLRQQVRQLQICVADLLATNQSLRVRLLSAERKQPTSSVPELESQS